MEHMHSHALSHLPLSRTQSAIRSVARSVVRSAAPPRVDSRACPVDTQSSDAIEHFETAMQRLVSYYGNAIEALDRAIDADSDWALAYLAKANCLLALNERKFAAEARQCLDQANLCATQSSRRERMHLAATTTCADGHWHEAVRRWEAILIEYPRDILALACAHVFDLYRGDALNLRRRVIRVLPDWSPGTPLRSYVIGMLAFGFEECNMYAMAEEAAQQALAIEPNDPWSIHALAHVYEMQGRHATGEQFLSGTQGVWASENRFAFHNFWHLCLFKLERLDTAGALEIFDAQFVAPAPEFAQQRVDATAMLMRLHLLETNVGTRWQAISDGWATSCNEIGFYTFNDVHAYIAHRASGNREAAAAVFARSMELMCTGSNHTMNREVGLPLMRGFAAYFDGRFAHATDELYAVRDVAHRFGGSHAQRDIVDQTLLASAIASKQTAVARHLINERIMAKPITPLTAHWQSEIGSQA
jgi:tetratricopeptide (TPR) repeat protein